MRKIALHLLLPEEILASDAKALLQRLQFVANGENARLCAAIQKGRKRKTSDG